MMDEQISSQKSASSISDALAHRSSGILCPLFSIPGVRDVGSLGGSVRAFIDFLARSGQTWFQMLPVNPIDEVGSPYAGRSAFAGETLYLDLADFRAQDLLDDDDLSAAWFSPKTVKRGDSSIPQIDARSERVDYQAAFARRKPCWVKAFERYRNGRGGEKFRTQKERFEQENADWLDDYAIFQTAAEVFGGFDWSRWPAEIRKRVPNEMNRFAKEYKEKIDYLRFLQLAFDVQWRELREYCAKQGVKLFGDVPIYVGRTSSDVWANPALFSIDEHGRAIREAGVPADSFNPDGQRWNSPIYAWEQHKATDFKWWKRRMIKTLERFDRVRLDHFIGFYNYYSFDGKEVLAQNAFAKKARALKRFLAKLTSDPNKRQTYRDEQGREYERGWTPGPQEAFLDAIFSVCPKDAFIAEDLGVMTQAVCDFRDKYDLPGMRVFQFCYDRIALDKKTGRAPKPLDSWTENFVAYTGTHDGTPILGWLDDVKRYGGRALKNLDFNAVADTLKESRRQEDEPAKIPALPEKKRSLIEKIIRQDKPKMGVSTEYRALHPEVAKLRLPVLRAVANSKCAMAIYPIQDAIGLSNDSRVNYPGVGVGNWTWRLAQDQLTEKLEQELREIAKSSGRLTKRA